MSNNLELATNAAVAREAAIIASRQALIGGQRGLDTKRVNAWCEYGFPEVVTDDMLFNLYRRGGVAFGAVNKVAGKCWSKNPQVIEGEESDESKDSTAWEKALRRVLTARVWRGFAEADRRRMATRYSALLLHVADGKGWGEAVDGNRRPLERTTPVWYSAIKPSAWDTNPTSAKYGQVTKWQYTEAGQNGAAGRSIDVHPDRVFILGDYTANAIGWLEPVYNAFVSLEKVEGGAGESYLKNSARQIAVSFDKEVDLNDIAATYGVAIEDLQDRFSEVAREMNRGNDAAMAMQGATVSTLVANAPDPEPFYNVPLKSISAGLDIAAKILVGTQTGERASTEDAEQFDEMADTRRCDLGFEIEDLVRHLQRIRIVEPMEVFSIVWDELTEAKTSERLGNAKTMAEINTEAISTGSPIFSDAQIRVAAGYEPESDTDGDETPNPPPVAE